MGTETLFALALLACPVGMGLMMLFMGRRMAGKGSERHGPDGRAGHATPPGDELARLQSDNDRLSERLEAIERERSTRSGADR